MADSDISDCFAAIKAIWTADALRLGDGAGVSVRDFERVGVDRFKMAPPFVLIEVNVSPDNTMLQTQRQVRGVFHIFTDIGRPQSEQDTIAEAIRIQYDEAELTGTDWVWSDMQIGATRQERGDNQRRHATIPFVTMGVRN